MRRFVPLAGVTGLAVVVALGACTSLPTPTTPLAPHGVRSAAPVARSAPAATVPSAPEVASGFRAGVGLAKAHRHIAAAANPLAAQAGLDMLRAGGSAVDAAIAMQMVLTLVEPQSSGIGGGAFLLHWDGHDVEAWDGRETAPAGVTERLFLDAGDKPMDFYDAVVGGRSVGAPGVLRMLERVHRAHGVLPWAKLFEPAIRLAEQGFPVSPRLHTLLSNERYLRNDPTATAYFYDRTGKPRAVGSLLRNPALAASFKLIAAKGADGFYTGPIARDIALAVRNHANAGKLTEKDLAAYQPRQRDALCSDYKRWRICGMPPPSSGGVAIAQIFGMLNLKNVSVVPPIARADLPTQLEPQADAVHLLSEIERLVFADRAAYVADPDFVAVNVDGLVQPAYMARRAALISDQSMGKATAGEPGGMRVSWTADPSPHKLATSHLSVVDSAGRAVSMTTSIEDQFGARLLVRGFLLNNQLTDFSFVPGTDDAPVANRVEPGKRPRSSMAPTLVFDRTSGELMAVLGSPGGSQIIGYVAKTLVGTLDWDMDVQQAIALPNFGSRNGPTEVEKGRVSPALIDGLKARGHEVREIEMTSGLQGLVRVREADGSSVWSGGADPRREGVALGD